LKTDGDALADAADFADGAAFSGFDGRVGGAQDEDAVQADTFEWLAEDSGLERGDVGGDVGELGHCYQVAANDMTSATNFFRWLKAGLCCR
jgi:hypothetical protein